MKLRLNDFKPFINVLASFFAATGITSVTKLTYLPTTGGAR